MTRYEPRGGSAAAAPTVPAAAVQVFLAQHGTPRRGPGRLWFRLYLVGLLTLPLLWSALQVADRDVPVEAADVVVSGLGAWLPVVIAMVLLAAARYATWAGPVVLAEPDVAWLLPAPITRVSLIRGRLLAGIGLAAAAGGVTGVLGFSLLVVETNAAPGPLLLATVVPAAAIGALAWALGWLVERSARASQAVLRATPLVVLLAVGSGLATFRLPWLQPVAWWSGPWGWAALPSIAAAGEVGMSSRAGTGAWPIAAGLLTLSTLAAVGVAVRTAGTIPAEELSRRAAPGSRVRNALFLLDFRAAAQVRREAGRRITTLRRTRIPRPRSPALAVVWRDLLSLLRTPTRALAALAGPPLVAAVAAGALLPAALTRPAIAVLGVAVALGYLASAALIDPVRTEMAYPFGERHLPWAPQRLVLLHLTVPIAVLWLLGGGSALVTAVLLSMSSAGVVATVAGVLLTAPVLICCAALAAVRPQPSAELLAMGDAGVGMFTARLLVGPQLAALLAYLPAFLAWTALQGGVGLSRVLLGSAGWATAAVALLLPRLQRHVAP